MKRMFEFVCLCGQRTESLTDYETVSVKCSCDGEAHRVISAPSISLEGWSGNFPSAWGRFDQKHRDKLAAERKVNQ